MPQIDVKPARIQGFWTMTLTVPEQDYGFWMGFTSGVDFAVHNRGLAVLI